MSVTNSTPRENEQPNDLVELPFEPLPYFHDRILREDPTSADSRGKRVGILIVTYNAVTTLTHVLKRIPPAVWRNVEEVVVFDDASQDATYELAVGIKTLLNIPKLKVLKHRKNLGYGGNQKAGYRYFIDRGFDVVVLLHGDGQYAPEILSHLYHPIVEGCADAVFGSRMMRTYGGPLKGGMPLYKFVGNRILTVFENAVLGMSLTEFHSGYRAYSVRALRELDLSRMTDNFHFDTEIIIKLHHQHFRIAEVPIPTYYGTELCYVNGLKYAKDVARAVWRYKQCVRSVQRFPEFEEYFVHYPLKQAKYSSHAYAIEMVGARKRVLDIGCGKGFLAAQLNKNDNRVTGVDALPASAVLPSLVEYHQADLNNGIENVLSAMKDETFDRVLMLDVLEHLNHPARLLQVCKPFLKESGSLIVSVPNVANITVRLMLLFGSFNYTDRGILDRTHLRFFTRKTARRLLQENGYEIVQQHMTTMPFELVLGLSPENPVMRLITAITAVLTRLMPGLMGYQIVFAARASKVTT